MLKDLNESPARKNFSNSKKKDEEYSSDSPCKLPNYLQGSSKHQLARKLY